MFYEGNKQLLENKLAFYKRMYGDGPISIDVSNTPITHEEFVRVVNTFKDNVVCKVSVAGCDDLTRETYAAINNIKGITFVDVSNISTLENDHLREFSKIRGFDISKNNRITHEGIALLPEGTKVLKLNRCFEYDCRNIQRFDVLEHLELQDHSGIRDEHLANFSASLRILDCSGCDGLVGKGLKRLKKLKKLLLGGCFNFIGDEILMLHDLEELDVWKTKVPLTLFEKLKAPALKRLTYKNASLKSFRHSHYETDERKEEKLVIEAMEKQKRLIERFFVSLTRFPLRRLEVGHLYSQKSLEPLKRMTSLEEVIFKGFDLLQDGFDAVDFNVLPISVKNLKIEAEMVFVDAERLQYVKPMVPITKLPRLRALHVGYIPSFDVEKVVRVSDTLHTLNVTMSGYVDFKHLKRFKHLRHLTLVGCNMAGFSAISTLPLETLHIRPTKRTAFTKGYATALPKTLHTVRLTLFKNIKRNVISTIIKRLKYKQRTCSLTLTTGQGRRTHIFGYGRERL